jgi:hypothetical protein
MDLVRLRVSSWLVATASLGALGCSDIVNPVAPELRSDLTYAGASASNKSDRKTDVHAIHVRISNMVFGTTVVDQYTFHVKGEGDDVKGQFFLYQIRIIEGVEEAVVIASGPAECSQVAGNKAKVGFRVDFTTFPEGIPRGSELTWSVTDNGKSANAQDFASQPLGNDARIYCAFGGPHPEHPVERGKIQVKD